MKFIVLDGLQKNTSTCSPLSTLTNYLSICVFHFFHKIICAVSYFSLRCKFFLVYVLWMCTQKHTNVYVYILYLFTYIFLGEMQRIFLP